MSKIKSFIINHFNVFAFIMFAVVIFSLYGRTLFFDFSYYDDDVLVLDRQEYLSFSNIGKIFSNTIFGESTDQFCRPVLNLTFLCEKYLYGIKPFGYHLTNLLLHLFSVFSVFLLFTLKYDKKKTFILCLLFACHPAIVQAVAWIPGRNDSLLALFIILSFYFFVKYTENAKSGYLFGYLFCFVLALLTKETAIVLPFFYFLFLLYKKRNVKQIVVSIIILSLIILIYFFYRKYVLSGQYIATFKEMFTNFYKALLPATPKYIANIFFPIKLSVFPAMLKVNYLLCTASFLSFVLLFIKLKSYDLKIVLIGICWFFFFLFPTYLMTDNDFYDHRIYVPLIGIMLAILEMLKEYTELCSKKFIALIVFFFLMFSSVTLYYEQKFQNKETFWVNALTMSPESDLANAMVGTLFFEHGLYKEAVERYLKAISIKETSTHYGNLAVVYAKIGDLDKTEKALLKSLEFSKSNPNTYYNLALVYKYKGNKEKAQEMKDKYIETFKKTNKVSKMVDINL